VAEMHRVQSGGDPLPPNDQVWGRSFGASPEIRMRPCFVCHYHEIALKKKNRDFFEGKLVANLKQALGTLPYRSVRLWSRRVVVELEPDSPVSEMQTRLGRVFGLANYAPAWIVSSSLESLQASTWSLIRDREYESFKVSARRADKRYPLKTPEIEREMGSFLQSRSCKRVQLEGPDLTCYVQVLGEEALLHFEKLPGPGGLPISTGGKVAVLISGGIDSPVAAYKIMTRGCRPLFVHFHSHPHTSLDAQEKVRELVELLCRSQPRAHLHMVPFAPVQRSIVALTPARTRVILYRRMMVRIANRIAFRARAKALVTGDSIGQVSSQTLDNIRVVAEASKLPILRPLIGEDKEEIITAAKRIGTFGVSIGADDDCCSMFVPKHPETRASFEQIQKAEAPLSIRELVDAALRETERQIIGPTTGHSGAPGERNVVSQSSVEENKPN
jgi:thiamine biosynthesis protein ThiI